MLLARSIELVPEVTSLTDPSGNVTLMFDIIKNEVQSYASSLNVNAGSKKNPDFSGFKFRLWIIKFYNLKGKQRIP